MDRQNLAGASLLLSLTHYLTNYVKLFNCCSEACWVGVGGGEEAGGGGRAHPSNPLLTGLSEQCLLIR